MYPLVIADIGFLLLEEQRPARPAASTGRRSLRRTRSCSFSARATSSSARASQLDALLELGIPSQRLRVVVNGVGPGATTRNALEHVLARQLAERGFALDAWLPWDGRALARAQRTGSSCRRPPARPYARAQRRLLDESSCRVAPAPRERKLRLVPPAPRDEEVEEEVTLPWRS